MALKSLKTKDRLFLFLVSFVALFLNFNQQSYAMDPDSEGTHDKTSLTVRNKPLTCGDVATIVHEAIHGKPYYITSVEFINTQVTDDG